MEKIETNIKAEAQVNVWAEQQCFEKQVQSLLEAGSPKAFVRTYGCQQNVSDSEKLSGMLEQMGYSFADRPEDADLIIFNTCAVREHAEQRVFGNVGALKKLKEANPKMIIALCGCMMQQKHIVQQIKKSYPYVDLVFGTGALPRFPELLFRVLTEGKHLSDLSLAENMPEGMPVRRDSAYKAWLPVMHGCNNFCTYCIVPYVRGREHSRAPAYILHEAEELIHAGTKEITLLGQNVNSYGNDSESNWDFSRLLDAVCKIPGDFRVSFMTSHPKDASHRLLETIAQNPKISRRLHLPFQSGSDRILHKMNRKYTATDYRALAAEAKRMIPGLCLTSDVIVGFPGETLEDFEQTLSLVKDVGFANLYTFLYSPRKGTPAAKMVDPVSREEKGGWFAELLKIQEENGRAFLESHIGKIEHVLAESVQNGTAFGRTDSGIPVTFLADRPGAFYDIKIKTRKGVTLFGEQKGTN